MEISTIQEWKEELGDALTDELHRINVKYRCKDFDYWGTKRHLEEEPTEFDIDRKGWEKGNSAEYIISALMNLQLEMDRFRSYDTWPLFNAIMEAACGNIPRRIVEHADEFVDGFHYIGIILQTNIPNEVVKRIQEVDTRLVVEIDKD